MASGKSSTQDVQIRAYDAINDFWQLHEDEVVELEVLPPAIQPPDGLLLQDGINLGIPKNILAVAFVEARQRFLRSRQDPGASMHALQATRVILLFDPEYVTAANHRKRVLISAKERDGSLDFRKTLERELCFLTSVLTSPLHRQSKSPTLWHHRLWILDHLVHLSFQGLSTSGKAAFWRSEIEAVCKSGEQHPKNYYAWQYARRLMPKIDDDNVSLAFAKIIMDWCFKHPSDISGWTFLAYLATGLHPFMVREKIFGQVFDFYHKLQIVNDSAWVFMRIFISQESLPEARSKLLELITRNKDEITVSAKSPAFQHRISQTLEWIHNFDQRIN